MIHQMSTKQISTPCELNGCDCPEYAARRADPRPAGRAGGARMSERSLWRCERCHAYHVGGLDIEDQPDDTIKAVCGAMWDANETNDELWEMPYVVADPYGFEEMVEPDGMTTFTVGQRVESHPATDPWIFGDRFGTVTKIGRKWVHVKMDRSGRTLRFLPDLLLPVSPRRLDT